MNGKFDFYLSEVSISNQHGAGITLQRILREDLSEIDLFVHISRLASDSPSIKNLANRCITFPMWPETDAARRIVGHTAAQWLYQRRSMKKIHARRIALYVYRRFSGKNRLLRTLVCPQSVMSLYAVDEISRRGPLEYVTWLMDDNLVSWNGTSFSYSSEIEKLLSKHLRRAKRIFTISPAMRDFIFAQFGVKSDVLFGPADAVASPVWQRPSQGKTVSIGYFGALGDWQTDALKFLTQRLESTDAALDIYGVASSLPACLMNSRVALRGFLQPSDVGATMARYDAVVIPASFEDRFRNLSQFNIATKMSECLASGTLTLLIAPPYAAMCKLLQEKKAAVIVSENSEAAFQHAISQIRNQKDRLSVLQAASEFASSDLSTDAMRRVWLRGIATISQLQNPDAITISMI